MTITSSNSSLHINHPQALFVLVLYLTLTWHSHILSGVSPWLPCLILWSAIILIKRESHISPYCSLSCVSLLVNHTCLLVLYLYHFEHTIYLKQISSLYWAGVEEWWCPSLMRAGYFTSIFKGIQFIVLYPPKCFKMSPLSPIRTCYPVHAHDTISGMCIIYKSLAVCRPECYQAVLVKPHFQRHLLEDND